MGIIDADTHIDETDATWEYMAGGDSSYKPTTAYPSNPDPKLPPARYWVIDGKRQAGLGWVEASSRRHLAQRRADQRDRPFGGAA